MGRIHDRWIMKVTERRPGIVEIKPKRGGREMELEYLQGQDGVR